MSKSKKALAVLITDTHLKESNEELVSNVFEQVIKICKKYKTSRLLHLGDWFTSRKAQSLSVLSTTLKIIDDLEKGGLSVDIIPGNHDKTDLNSDESFLDLFDTEYFGVRRNFKTIFFANDVTVSFAPYYKEEKFKEELIKLNKTLDKKYKNVLLAHTAKCGAVNNDGSKVSNSLDDKLFSKFDKVFIGHYHNQSNEYIGSAYQANFGEDELKGCTVLFDDLTTEFVQLDFPKYVKFIVPVDNKKLFNSNVQQADKYKQQNKKDIVRIVLSGDKDKINSIDKSQFVNKGLQVVTSFDDISVQTDYEENDFKVFDNNAIVKEFENFCNEKQLDTKLGLKLLTENIV